MTEPPDPETRVSVTTPLPLGAAVPEWYPALLDSVSERVVRGHRRAVAAANSELTATYWAIGRDILNRQAEQGWGSKVIDRLSADLKRRFPDARGYSPRNLNYMRALAQAWPDPEFVQRCAAQFPRVTIRPRPATITQLRDAWSRATELRCSRDLKTLQNKRRYSQGNYTGMGQL